MTSPDSTTDRLQRFDHAQADLTPTQRGSFRTYLVGSFASSATDEQWDRALRMAREMTLTETDRWAQA